MKASLFCCLLFFTTTFFGQSKGIPDVDHIILEDYAKGKLHKVWLTLGEDGFNEPIKIPVIIAKGKDNGKVLGLTAAIHGNELNGIRIIQQVMSSLDVSELNGTVVAIPGLNPLAIASNQREYVDLQDLNRLFPGKNNGNRSQQMTYQIAQKVIPLFDYHVDLHTASFGRVNSLYGRGNMDDEVLANMLRALEPDIIVSNKGKASFGEASGLTMRAFAIGKGVKSITVEFGDPQVYQDEMIGRGIIGIQKLLKWFQFTPGAMELAKPQNVCSKSYWLFTKKGGYLEVFVKLKEKVTKGQSIGVLRDSFGDIIEEYVAPEAGIVIGKSTNPVNISGGRIIHLGILE